MTALFYYFRSHLYIRIRQYIGIYTTSEYIMYNVYKKNYKYYIQKQYGAQNDAINRLEMAWPSIHLC